MKTGKILAILISAMTFVLFGSQALAITPIGTAFTYQGMLLDANRPADGPYDVQFRLYDANMAGNKIARDVNAIGTDVVNGNFTVSNVDFGYVPNGNASFIEIGVRPGDSSGPYTTLIPRQQIRPAPVALAVANATFSGVNTYAGNGAGNANTTGYNLTFIGNMSGSANTTGNNNTVIGAQAGVLNTTGSGNTVLGSGALYYNTTGNNNTMTGYQAGQYVYGGSDNTFTGALAGGSAAFAGGDTFTGSQAGFANTTGSDNTFTGYRAGYSNTIGNANTFTGAYAGYSDTTGNSNTFFGHYAGFANTTGIGNVCIGFQAGMLETGSNKLYIANGTSDALIYGDFATKRVGINTINPQGTLDVSGSIYQRGGVLYADYVFEPGYGLESIEEHSKFMWQQKHLEAIPHARVDENCREIIEVGAQNRGTIEELEKAHIYIEQLNNRIKMLEERLTKLETQTRASQQSQDAGK